MDERWMRGIAVFGGAIGSIVIVGAIVHFLGTDDVALTTTFVALGSASFAVAILERLRARFPAEQD